MPDRDPIDRLIATLADYREGELAQPTRDHIERWASQFDSGAQDDILRELAHVLPQTYLSKKKVSRFLVRLARNEKLGGSDPSGFWKRANFLQLQDRGTSQRHFLDLFATVLSREYEIAIEDCGSSDGPFIYLDDGVFSGNTVRQDLEKWIANDAPREALVHIIAPAVHTGAKWYVDQWVERAAKDASKEIAIQWWRVLLLEGRKAYTNASDVLRPTRLPDHEAVQQYCTVLKDAGYPPVLRKPNGKSAMFSSERGRDALEQAFLKAGTEIRQKSPNLNEYQRPLGNVVLSTLGFGTLVITYRNCPNNAPLALWAGSPWYPLLPRRTT